MSRERLEPDDEAPLEKRLRFIDEDVPRKQPKIYKHPRSQLLDRAARFLPEMQKADARMAEELKVMKASSAPQSKTDVESMSGYVEMTLDCGVFDVLKPSLDEIDEESEKFNELKRTLDSQLDALTDEDILGLFAETGQRLKNQGDPSEKSETSTVSSDNEPENINSPEEIQPTIESNTSVSKKEKLSDSKQPKLKIHKQL